MAHAWPLCLAALLACLCVSAAPASHEAFRQDAYIWQRHWTPALDSAVQRSADVVDGWRVLAAETDGLGHLRPVQANWELLAVSDRPVTPVIRIDGQLQDWSIDRLVADIGSVVSELRATHVPVAGLEIDHDCATARLPKYAAFMKALRRALPDVHLSMTALPAWMESSQLDALLAQADEVVLQVHAVRDPRSGLFDTGIARDWIERFSVRIHGPFRVALPAYGVRVTWGERGEIAVVESEMPRFSAGTDAAELMASPSEVAALLSMLRKEHLAHLAGVVWFRLPTDEDSRAWNLATLRAVMQGMLPEAVVSVELRESSTPGMSDVLLGNPGPTDAELPQRIALPVNCGEADGINGYSLERVGLGLALTRLQSGILHGHHQRLIGWARCTQTKVAFDAHP
ncbi:MAG TPA: DUF3142 domain-containing protein [Gammaproteobacteria bacterium]